MRKIMLLLFGLFTVLGSYAQIGIIQGLNSTTLPTGWTTSGFYNTTTTPCEGTHAWRINFYSAYDPFDDIDYGTLTGSITSPNLSTASNGTDTNVSFDWKATEYDAGSGIGYTMYVEYSTNNGTNWTQIGSPIVANATTTCSSFTNTIPGASLPTGSNFKFRVRGVWSAGDSYFWIDNVVITQATAEVPSCITLTSPANEATNISSGLLTWAIPSGIPTGFKLRIGTTSGGTQILNNEDVGMVTSYTLNNLSSGTTYYVTVIPYNLNGDATGCVETSFSTCGTVSNFTQGFENTATATIMPECWSRKYVSTSTFATVNVSTSYAKTGTKSLAFYNSADTAAQLYAISPMLDNIGTGTNRIRFSARAGATTTSIEVGTMSDPTDETTFNSLETYPLTTNFQDFILNLDFTGTGSYIVFKTNFATTYTYAYIDDVVWEPIPNCPDTTGLSFENVESDTATINWEPGNDVTAWQYAIGAASVTDPSTLTAVDVTGGNPTADVDNLTPNTTYKFWVRSNCGSSEFGAWAGPVTFTTACTSFAIPSVVENFEGTTGTALPGCWSTTNVSGTVSWNTIAPGTTGDITTTVSGTRIASKTYTSSNALLFSTPFDYSAIIAATRVNLYLHRHASAAAADKYTIYANTTPSLEGAEMLLEVFSKTTSAPAVAATGFYNYTAEIPEFFNGAPQVYIIIQGYTNDGFSSYTLGVDDFKVEYLPACADVTNVSVENVTITTATINWQPGGSETAWQYAIGASSVTDPATLTAVDVTGGNPTANVNDLTPNTTYKVWVRSNCGSGSFGVWSPAVSFTTACAAEMAPTVLQSFESAVPACWSEATGSISSSITLSGTTSAWGAATSFANATGGTNKAIKINLYGTKNDWIISNPIDLGTNAGQFRVSYRMALTSYDGTATQATLGTHKVSVIVSTDGGQTWSDADVIKAYTGIGNYSNTGQMEKIDLTAYSGIVKIAFVATTTELAPDVHFHIDDFKVEELPACADVFNLLSENVLSNAATLNWESNGTETAWQYAIGSSTDTDPSTLTAVEVTGGNTTANITDLTPNTTYKFWVRANCGSGSFGAWVGPVSFTTACTALAIPSSLENFDTTTGTALPGCWSTAAVSGATVWAGFTPGTSGDVTTTVSGSRVVAKTYTSSDALLFSTPFDYSAITEDTRVNLYLHRHASAAATDKYAVYVNTSASLVGAEMLLEVFSKTTIEPTVAVTGFYNYTADIPASFNGAPQVYIIIQGYTNSGFSSYTLAVDDFKVELTDDLKTDTRDLNAFKFYPNPVKDILNVTYTQNITNVEVFNMLGQQVIAKSVNATEGKVDMSNLASGTYLVKVVADQQVKTLKIIKQ